MLVAADRDVGIYLLALEVDEVVVRPVAGIGEDALGSAPGVGLDLVDEVGQ